MEKTKFTASKKKKRKPQPNEDLRLASKSNSTVYRAWVGKAETRQPGRYKLNRTFCHLILGLQFFYPPGASIIRAQLRHKNLVTVSHPCLCFKSKLTAFIQNTVSEKICIENLATYSHFFSTRPYYEYCSLNLCNSCLLCYEQFIWFRAH